MIMQRLTQKGVLVFCLLVLINVIFTNEISSQNVSVTDDEFYTAASSAMLDVKSISKGLLIPRLTSVQREAINPAATGLLVFDTDKNAFYYYDGSEWLALPQVSSSTGVSDALFAVKNAEGDTIFAVYNDGVKVVVPYGTKGKVGGFAVSGRSPTKAGEEEYLLVTPDSTRVFVNEVDVKGRVGGFAVSGRSPTKSVIKDYFISSADSTRVYVPEGLTKGKVGGFAVSGRSPTKLGGTNDYFNISGNSQADTVKNEPRIMWYPVKASFLAGEVHVGSADSVGMNSTSLGYRTIAMGDYSQAMGYKAQSLGLNSTAIGNNAIAKSNNSFAFGDSAQATNLDSYAFGAGAVASGIGSYAFGSQGRDTLSLEPISAPTKAEGEYSFAIGQGAYAKGNVSTSIGNNTTAEGRNSLALGSNTLASGNYSTAIGIKTIASGAYGTAMGYFTKATNNYSTAIGANTTASGGTSFAAGAWTIASGGLSIATGYSNTSSGYASFTLGKNNQASGAYSIAAGSGLAIASGNNAVAIGEGAVAQAYNSFVIGRYNIVEGNMTDWIVTEPLFVIGYGQSHSKANALTVLKNGYVGIGVSSPSEKFHTTGGVRFEGYTGTGIRLLTVDPNGNISTTGGLSNNITWDAANGRLGIGITSPTRTLHLYSSTTNGQLLIQRYANAVGDVGAIIFKSHISTPTGYEKGGIFFENTNTAYGYGSLHFATNNTASSAAVTKADARMTITSAGSIGIGTTSPGSFKLNVQSSTGGVTAASAYFLNTATNGIAQISRTNSTDGTVLLIQEGTGYSLRCDAYDPSWFVAMIVKGRNMGINTDSPTQNLDVNGNARFRSIGSGAYSGVVNRMADGTLTTATSDIRLKENITTLNNGLHKVLQLRGVNFTWKSEPQMGTRIGFIAQEVEEIIPELVFTNEVDGYKGVNYAEMTAVLVEAVKEQQNMITNLK